MKSTAILLVGPSCAGKTVISRMMTTGFESHGLKGLGAIPSATTRSPRKSDVMSDQQSYEYFTREEFQELIDSGEMIRYVDYAGHYYGMRKSVVAKTLDQYGTGVIGINEEGVKDYVRWFKGQGLGCVVVFVLPYLLRGQCDIITGLEEIRRRMQEDRSDLSVDQIRLRVSSAQECLLWMLNHSELSQEVIVTWRGDFRSTSSQVLYLLEKYSVGNI